MGAKVTDPRVLELGEPASGTRDPNLIELSTGVVLRARPVPKHLYGDIVARFPEPTPPVAFIAEKGREEENPDDPDYLQRRGEQRAQLAKAMNDALIILGTSIEHLPKSFPGPDHADFLEEMAALGYDVANHKARYLAWVKYKAMGGDDDFDLIWKGVGRLSGVVEDDVAAAVAKNGGQPGRSGHRRRRRADGG